MIKLKNVVSCFDGLSGGQISLNRLGILYENYYASEIDKDSINICQTNFKNTIQLGDITKIDTSSLNNVDLVIGGSPCQSFSISGKMNGMSTIDNIKIITLEQYLELKNKNIQFDGYSYLFWEYVRILRELKPKYFLLENVKMKKEWEDVITNTLGVIPIRINSSLVSAGMRDRYYWTNIPNIKQPEDTNILLEDVIVSGKVDRKKSLCITKRYEGFSGSQSYLRRRYFGKSMGQAVFENCEPSYQRALYITDERKEYTDQIGYIRSLTTKECERIMTIPEGYVENVIGDTQKAKGIIGNGWTIDVICHILKNM